jgi:hypothetical protein
VHYGPRGPVYTCGAWPPNRLELPHSWCREFGRNLPLSAVRGPPALSQSGSGKMVLIAKPEAKK